MSGWKMLFAVLGVVWAACGAAEWPQPPADASSPLEERFAAPPAGARILPIQHILPDEPEKQDALLDTLQRRGFGGMATNVNFHDYMKSEAHWGAFLRVVAEAKKRGMALWLYDERGYPSGNAGGLTMEGHPEWQARGLLIAQTESAGGPVALDAPPGTLSRAAAFPIRDGEPDFANAVDLAGFVKEGALAWEAPAGEWRVMLVTEDALHEGTHAAVSLADKLPYINLLMPEPTVRFLELTHGAYTKRLGDELGTFFTATFTDEPSLMSLFMRKQPWSVLPWAPNLPEAFEKRNGYTLDPIIPLLVLGSGPVVEKARFDFWGTVGDLVSENYFGYIQDWCWSNNLPSGGHLLLEEPILTHVPLYGNFFQCLFRLGAPSMDCLTSIPAEVPWQVARLVSSVADLKGHPVTMSEASDHSQRWRAPGDDRPVYRVSEEEIRGSLNLQILNGITTFTSYYAFDGLADEQFNRLNDWVGRCCTMLKGGVQVTDWAVVYPAETLMARFAPSRDWVREAPAEARLVERMYDGVLQALFHAGRDFSLVDGAALAWAGVGGGALDLGKGVSRRAVILPCVDTLPLAAWENLAALWRSGGVVIAVGALPVNSEKAFPCPAARAISQELFGGGAGGVRTNDRGGAALYLPVGQDALLSRALDAVLAPDVAFPVDAPLHATHRKIDGHEVYFVINNSPAPWSGTVSISAEGAGERWDPATGAVTPEPDPSFISLTLEGYSGMLFRFEDAVLPKRQEVPAGPLGGVTAVSLPPVEPGVVRGEHVEAEMTALAAGGPWRAGATLTKGDVDTFLFLNFVWPVDQNLAANEFLAFDVEVPEGQRCGTDLLVIVRDARGVEALAGANLPLALPGSLRVYVPLKRFARAGWSGGPEGPVDFSQVREIRIGWGGYHGNTDEVVAFTASAPLGVDMG